MSRLTIPASRMRSFALAVCCVALAGLVPAASANAKRRVSFGTFGVNVAPQLLSLSPAQLDAQFASMARAGVETARINFSWEAANPRPGVYSWDVTDKVVHAAAKSGIDLLPVVEFTPKWASSRPNDTFFAQFEPKSDATFGTFFKAAIRRYGPRGSYWRANRRVAKRPLRYWGIWNEPSQPFPWQTRPWQRSYVRLLKAAYRAIHKADHGAKVVSASLSGHGPIKGSPSEQFGVPVWGDVKDLYKAGGRRYFDILSINFYTNGGGISVGQSISREFLGAKYVRDEMRRHGDRRKPIWLTEVTWLAAQGKVPRSNYSGSNAFEPVPTTFGGQAARMRALYRKIASRKGASGVSRAFWFTWATSYKSHSSGYEYTGLNSWNGKDVFRPVRLLGVYRGAARSLEGCRKSSSARHCAK